MRIVLALVMTLVAGNAAHAQTQTYYLHNSPVPVVVPGGSTNFFLDPLAPSTATPLVEERIIASGASDTFPTFTAPAFASDTTLSPIASVRLQLGANAKMRGCADYSAELFKLDAGGVPTSIGTGSVLGGDIAQGTAGGTAGTTSRLVEFPISDTSVLTGESLAVATSFTNQCGINRRVFFAYDGTNAPARVRFQCCLTTSARCAAEKIKAVGGLASCYAGAESKAAGRGEAVDPASFAKCDDRALGYFDKAELRGGCVTIGDAPVRIAETYAFTSGQASTLDPGPTHENRCGAYKLKLVGATTKCLLSLHAKAAAKAEFLEPDPTSAQKCRDKLTIGFGKIDDKYACDTEGDAAATVSAIDAFVQDVASDLACPCE